MPSTVIQGFFNDASVPHDVRAQVYNDLHNGTVDESTLEQKIVAKQGNKYGGATSTPAKPSGVNLVQGLSQGLNTFKNLPSTIGPATTQAAQTLKNVGSNMPTPTPQEAHISSLVEQANAMGAKLTKNVPSGQTPEDYINYLQSGLSQRQMETGNPVEKIQGVLNNPQVGNALNQVATTAEQVPVVGAAPRILSNAFQATKQGVNQFIEGAGQLGESVNPFTPATASNRISKSSLGVANMIGGGTNAAFALPGAAVGSLPYVGPATQQALGYVGNLMKEGAQKIKDAAGAPEGSDQAKAIDQHMQNLGNLLPMLLGQYAHDVVAGKGPMASDIGQVAKGGIQAAKDLTSNIGEKVLPDTTAMGAKITGSINKIDPSKVTQFQKMTGKTPGEWLQDRGIISPRKVTVSRLVEYWKQAKDAVDNALSKIPNKFQDKSVETILKDQIKYFTDTADRSNLNLAKRRLQTLQDEGLTLSQSNAVKRTYEATQKLGYLKDRNSTGIVRATNLDSSVRKFIENKAAESGFNNLKDLNKETQGAKFLADEIYKKMNKQSVNDTLGLTDKLLFYGGMLDPKAWAALGLKKLALGEGTQAVLGRILSPEATKGIPEVPLRTIELKANRNQLNKAATLQSNNPNSEAIPTANPITANGINNNSNIGSNPNTSLPEKSTFSQVATPKSAENSLGSPYPLENINKWYGDSNYKAEGGKLTYMSPDEFLLRAKPLQIDDIARENIDNLEQHILEGKKLDPLVIYTDDISDTSASDGRHRAIAAKELGIKKVPVVDYTLNDKSTPSSSEWLKGNKNYVKVDPDNLPPEGTKVLMKNGKTGIFIGPMGIEYAKIKGVEGYIHLADLAVKKSK